MGGDHYRSFQGLSATVDFRIAIKEILEHLRSALDYCAREISERSSRLPAPSNDVYFPIARKGSNPKDFRSVVGKCVPGVLANREDLVATFASFQEFSSPKNSWLPDLATLCNENKHEQLSAQQARTFPGSVSEKEGTPVYTINRKDNTPMEDGFLIGFLPDPSEPDKRLAVYFRFDAIDYEVASFLQLAITGVESIIKELMTKV